MFENNKIYYLYLINDSHAHAFQFIELTNGFVKMKVWSDVSSKKDYDTWFVPINNIQYITDTI